MPPATPTMLARNDSAIAANSTTGVIAGKFIAERSGHARASLPDTRAILPASQRFKRLVSIAVAAAMGGITVARRSSAAAGSPPFGNFSGSPPGGAGLEGGEALDTIFARR